MAGNEITGNVRDRFIQAAVLLQMLDPVRGEPMAYGLDLHEIDSPRERLLKRKFLDSIALVCAIKKDGNSVSAACIEEGRPVGTVIRIASNSGVSETTLRQVQELVNILHGIASQVRDASDGEEEILLRIIQLDITKIRQYLKDVRTAKDIFDEPVSAVASRVMTALSHVDSLASQQFLEWLGHLSAIKNLAVDPEPETLVDYIKWAQKAKRYFLDSLTAVFSAEGQSLPRWIRTIFKLGRYGVASRAFAQLASELPALVSPMTVESIVAPSKRRYTVSEEDMPLTCVLRRVVGDRAEEFVSRLAQIWNTTDAETYFRRACSLDLVAHAEMQLVSFYDHNQQWRPTFRFIGVSKKSCYLCHLFLTNHPNSFSVSSCHQKLYPCWIPPPAINVRVYRRYRMMTTELSKVMEATATQDLDNRLGIMRRPVPADSTAGVSLSGLTGSIQTVVTTKLAVESRTNPTANDDFAMTVESRSTLHSIEVVSLTSENLEVDPSTFSEGMLSVPTDLISESGYSQPAIVFHFTRLNDASKQDIIRSSDIVDQSTGCPSWTKLVEILEVDEGFGLAFKEGSEFLMVNDKIRVSNERQLLACLQYLHNADILNAEVSVCMPTRLLDQ